VGGFRFGSFQHDACRALEGVLTCGLTRELQPARVWTQHSGRTGNGRSLSIVRSPQILTYLQLETSAGSAAGAVFKRS